MYATASTTEVLARAIDICALKQAVYSANIANANVEGYRRIEVLFDAPALQFAAADQRPHVTFAAQSTVKLDEEMAAMARNALRYQTLLGAYQHASGLLRMAIHEGKEI